MATTTSPVYPGYLEPPENHEQVQEHALSLEERIRQRAHQIWLENGSTTGTELIDWLEAEEEVLSELRTKNSRF